MNGQQISTLAFTFMVGIAAGFYLYVIGFAPQVARVSDTLGLDTTDEIYRKGLVIEGEEYGACGNSCASFQLRADRQFSFLRAPGQSPVTGEVSRALYARLEAAAVPDALAAYALPSTAPTCVSDEDSSDVAYDISVDGTVVNLDTCRTQLTPATALYKELAELWKVMRNTGS
jgi:hypothetical protein